MYEFIKIFDLHFATFSAGHPHFDGSNKPGKCANDVRKDKEYGPTREFSTFRVPCNSGGYTSKWWRLYIRRDHENIFFGPSFNPSLMTPFVPLSLFQNCLA